MPVKTQDKMQSRYAPHTGPVHGLGTTPVNCSIFPRQYSNNEARHVLDCLGVSCGIIGGTYALVDLETAAERRYVLLDRWYSTQ